MNGQISSQTGTVDLNTLITPARPAVPATNGSTTTTGTIASFDFTAGTPQVDGTSTSVGGASVGPTADTVATSGSLATVT